MATIHTNYIGALRTQATHIKSGEQLTTDAPTDNNGKGETFSPTDLLATALGSCMLTIMGIAANKNGFNIDNTTVETTKIMADSPRRVCEIHIKMNMPHNNYSDTEKKIIYNAAVNCPVAKSLSSELKQVIEIKYP